MHCHVKEQYSLYFHLRKELVRMEENGGLSDGKFSTVSREKGIQRGDRRGTGCI